MSFACYLITKLNKKPKLTNVSAKKIEFFLLLANMKQIRNQELLIHIALRIKQLREKNGVSQEIMYFDTQIHVARIETAKCNLTISTLDAICAYFGITLSEFFAGI